MTDSSVESVDVPCYIQVEPEYSRWMTSDKPEAVNGARAVRLTQRPSTSPKPGALTVKVTLRIPKAAFVPLSPEAVVVIPADFTDPTPVEVIASDAHQNEE